MSSDAQSTESTAHRPRRLSLRRNFSWTFVGNLTYTCARWGMLMVLAKLGDVTAVGVYALGLAVCQPINFLTSLHLRPAMVTDASNEYSYGQYIGLRIVGAVFTVIFVTAVAVGSELPSGTRSVVIIVGFGTAVFAVREIIQGISQKHERMDVTGRSQILLAILSFAAFLLLFATTRSVIWAALGLLLSRSVVLFFYDLPRARSVVDDCVPPGKSRSFRPVWSVEMLGKLFRRVWPLGLAMTIGSFTNNVQHYLLQYYHGTSSVGYYGALASVMQAAIMLTSALGIAASPRLAGNFLSQRGQYVRLLLKLQGIVAMIGVLGVLLTVLVGDVVLALLFQADYADYKQEFVWLAIATTFMFSASVLSNGLTAARAFYAQLLVWVVVAPVTVLLAWVLIPTYGIRGAVWGRTASTALLMAASTIALFVVTKRRSGPKHPPATQVSNHAEPGQ